MKKAGAVIQQVNKAIVLFAIIIFFFPSTVSAQVSNSAYKFESSEKLMFNNVNYISNRDGQFIGASFQNSYERNPGDYIAETDMVSGFTLGSNMNVQNESNYFESGSHKGILKGIRKITSSRFIEFGDQIYFLISYLSKTGTNEVIRLFQFENGNFKSVNSELFPLKLDGENPFRDKYSDSQVGVFCSEDNLYAVRVVDRSKGESTFNVEVLGFNADLEQTVKYTSTFILPKGKATFYNPFITNDGAFYFTCKILDPGKKAMSSKDDINYLNFYKLDPAKDQAEVIEMGGDKKKVKNVKIAELNNGVVICTGYLEKEDASTIFSGKFDGDDKTFHEEDLDVNKFIFPYDYKRQKVYSMGIPVEDHRVLHAINTDDNGVIFVSEEQIVNKMADKTHLYYDKEIFVTKLNAKGEVQWISAIDKNQGSNDLLAIKSSFSMFYDKKEPKIFLVFNDWAKNYNDQGIVLEKTNQKELINKHNYLVVATVDLTNGAITQEVVRDNSTDKMDFLPQSGFADVENGYLYGYFKKGAFDPFGKIGRLKLK
ncbi:MAG: hypothetical protein GQ574_22520 [Crocinitomix sp.]|nr:hypothetical protein [Crocinitomix sp.]